MKLDYGTYLQFEKYYYLGEAIKDLAPELLEDPELRRREEALHLARESLGTYLYQVVEPEEWL